MTTTTTTLDKSLNDLRQEIVDLKKDNYDINRLGLIITLSKDSLHETEKSQQILLNQLLLFETSLAEINQILRKNVQEKIQLEQQQTDDDIEIRTKLMQLNAEALECRAAVVQLQQNARLVLNKAMEVEKRANDELSQQALEIKIKQQEMERKRIVELEKQMKLEQQQQQQSKEVQQPSPPVERPLPSLKISHQTDEYANWTLREFMHDNQYPSCIVRTSPDACSMPIEIQFLTIDETENLLDNQEELISTPMKIKFESIDRNNESIILAMPYVIKRSSHRENIIKIRQTNGIWISIETNEISFDTHKDKRFVECKLNQSSLCAVVSRLKHDTILIKTQSSGRYNSTADQRFTIQWPKEVTKNDIRIDTCMQPIDLPTFTQFCQHYSHESNGLIAVGPIIDLTFEDLILLKPLQFTLPILIQPKKKKIISSRSPSIVAGSDDVNTSAQPPPTPSQPSAQETLNQKQQSIFKSMLGEDSTNEQLVLLYSGSNENVWHIDKDIQLFDSKGHDIITTNIQELHTRMIVARYDKQLMSLKQLQTTICLFEQTLQQRSATFILRHRLSNLNEICLVCCSNQRTDIVDNEIQQENYTKEHEQIKQVPIQEGQLLELRFRGNILPIENSQQIIPFAFNTYFPFYFETNMIIIDKYSQHLSSYFYGFIQIFSKQKNLRMKEFDKKKQSTDIMKSEWQDNDICLAELLITLPKPREEISKPITKILTTFTSEGVLTPQLFRDMSVSLSGDEWRKLARRLGMTRIRIEAIEHDYHEDAPYYMLLTWFKRVPRSSDKVLLLTNGLININRWDLAQDLQGIQDDKRNEQGSLSRDDLLKTFQTPFNRICQRDECVRIWKLLARELMLTNDDIQIIEQKYPSKHERCMRSLEHWALHQTRADIPCLAKIIRTLGFKPLAREIENMA